MPRLPKIIKKSAGHGGKRAGTGGSRPGAGRPRTITDEEKSAVERARHDGRSALPKIMAIQIKIAMNPTKYGVAACQRAAEYVSNRTGLPPEQKVTGDGEGKAILALVAALEVADAPES